MRSAASRTFSSLGAFFEKAANRFIIYSSNLTQAPSINHLLTGKNNTAIFGRTPGEENLFSAERISIKFVNAQGIETAIDAIKITNSNAPPNSWCAYSGGNADTMERSLQNRSIGELAEGLNSNIILFNYPGVMDSQGRNPLTKDLVDSYKAVLNCAEEFATNGAEKTEKELNDLQTHFERLMNDQNGGFKSLIDKALQSPPEEDDWTKQWEHLKALQKEGAYEEIAAYLHNELRYHQPGELTSAIGLASRMVDQKKMIELKEKKLVQSQEANKVFGFGYSIGGLIQGDALNDYSLKQGIQYCFAKDRTGSSMWNALHGLGKIAWVMGNKLNAEKSTKETIVPQVVIQRYSETFFSRIKRQMGALQTTEKTYKVTNDKIFSAPGALASTIARKLKSEESLSENAITLVNSDYQDVYIGMTKADHTAHLFLKPLGEFMSKRSAVPRKEA